MNATRSHGDVSNEIEALVGATSGTEKNGLPEHFLVRECLSGSQDAWREFYSRYVFLMRSVVKRNRAMSPEDVEDITQTAFLSLSTALHTYDFKHPLSRFVCLVTERVLVDEYRRRSAAKRSCETELLDVSDPANDAEVSNGAPRELQDARMEKAENCSRLREALRELDPRCRKLLELRYFNEIPYTEIAEMAGATKNTLIVRARRCLEKLRTRYEDLQTRGLVQ